MGKEKGTNWRVTLSALTLTGNLLGLTGYQDQTEQISIRTEELQMEPTKLGSFFSRGEQQIKEENKTVPISTEEEKLTPFIYVIKEGDTLSEISKKNNGLPVNIIYKMNERVIGGDPDILTPGQEFLIVRWGPIEASRYLASGKAQEVTKKGKAPDWIYSTLTSELSAREVADFFGISVEKIASLNEIDDPNIKLPKDYCLMVPIGEGFVFTETDRLAGRKWQPRPEIAVETIWWEDSSGQKVDNPEYPNIAFIMEPFPSESWVSETWSTADQLPSEDFVSETVTDIPANRIWEIVDKEGNVTQEERTGFLVYGKHKIVRTGCRKVKAGRWVLGNP